MNISPEQTMRTDETRDEQTPSKGDSATELHHDIEQTRAQMSGTIDAIQERLTPQQMLARAKDALVVKVGQRAAQAQALGGAAQTRATDLALIARGQGTRLAQQLRARFERLRLQYPWLPAALVTILTWRVARSDD